MKGCVVEKGGKTSLDLPDGGSCFVVVVVAAGVVQESSCVVSLSRTDRPGTEGLSREKALGGNGTNDPFHHHRIKAPHCSSDWYNSRSHGTSADKSRLGVSETAS